MPEPLAVLIRTRRDDERLTQGQLAARLRVDQTLISRWEAGKTPGPANYASLAEWLGMTEDDLAARADQERNAAGIRVPDSGRAAARIEASLERLETTIAGAGVDSAALAKQVERLRKELGRLTDRVARLEAAGQTPSSRPRRPAR